MYVTVLTQHSLSSMITLQGWGKFYWVVKPRHISTKGTIWHCCFPSHLISIDDLCLWFKWTFAYCEDWEMFAQKILWPKSHNYNTVNVQKAHLQTKSIHKNLSWWNVGWPMQFLFFVLFLEANRGQNYVNPNYIEK